MGAVLAHHRRQSICSVLKAGNIDFDPFLTYRPVNGRCSPVSPPQLGQPLAQASELCSG